MTSSSLIILSIQMVLSLLVFSMLSTWYLWPNLQKYNKSTKLTVLLFFHAFRFLPLVLLAEEQIVSNIPMGPRQIIAYGDFISSLLAIVAIFSLRYFKKSSITSVWVFSIFSTIDIVSALIAAMVDKLYIYNLGVNWFILIVYVPIVIITQVMIFKVLLSKNN